MSKRPYSREIVCSPKPRVWRGVFGGLIGGFVGWGASYGATKLIGHPDEGPEKTGDPDADEANLVFWKQKGHHEVKADNNVVKAVSGIGAIVGMVVAARKPNC
jgi:hypothetical protein